MATKMDSNQLREYVRELNKQEALITEARRQQALNKIKELRKQLRERTSHTEDFK